MIDHETRRKQIRLEGRLALPESEQSRGAPPSFAVYWKGGERSQRPSAAAPASDVVADRRAVDFWRSVGFRGEVATAEALLRSAFPRELERRLETAFATKGVPRPIEPVSLEVLAVRYGSLEFLVGGAGVAAFASMVQSVGPAVALMLIEACVQDSLEATFDVSARDATVQLRSGSFGAPPSTAGPGTGAAQGTWGQVLSAAPKVFWLLPTLLALIVLWVELTGVHSHMERIARRETELGKMQEALSATWEARIKQLEALNADLVKQLRVPPADQKESTACGCIPCCVNPPACPPSPPDPPRAGTPRRLPSCKQR